MERYNIKNKELFKVNQYQQQVINKFSDTLNSESYKKISNCIICNKKKFLLLSDIDRQGIKHPTTLCKECGYCFNNPQFTDETHKNYYENFYREIDRDFKVPSKEFYELEKHRGADILNYLYLNGSLDKNTSCLDVGCGSGATSFIFANFFKSTIGIDLAKEYTKNVEQLDNLKILHTTIHDKFFDDKKFGFINYCHVFEHINDPLKDLERLKKIIKDDGYLYIEVPGIYHTDQWYDGNFFHSLEMDHTHFLTLTTLKNMMIKNDFELVHGDEIIRSIWKLNKDKKVFFIENDFNNILKQIKKSDNLFRINYIKIKKNFKNLLIGLIKFLLKKIGLFNLIKKFYLKKNKKRVIYKNKKIYLD